MSLEMTMREVWTTGLRNGADLHLAYDSDRVRVVATQTRKRDGKHFQAESDPIYIHDVSPATYAEVLDSRVNEALTQLRREMRGGWYTIKELA